MQKYEIYNKRYKKSLFFESEEYCAGTRLGWYLIINDWSIKDCVIRTIGEKIK